VTLQSYKSIRSLLSWKSFTAKGPHCSSDTQFYASGDDLQILPSCHQS